MNTTSRIKAGMVAAAVAMGSLLVSAPSASASGNCYHYGQAGYGQVFTDANYRGDCFEWELTGGIVRFPDNIENEVSSIRTWSNWPYSQVILRDSWDMQSFNVGPNTSIAWLQYFNDRANWVEG